MPCLNRWTAWWRRCTHLTWQLVPPGAFVRTSLPFSSAPAPVGCPREPLANTASPVPDAAGCGVADPVLVEGLDTIAPSVAESVAAAMKLHAADERVQERGCTVFASLAATRGACRVHCHGPSLFMGVI